MSVADATEKPAAVALPPRRQTFLARYPRNLKLAAVAVIFAAVVLPGCFLGGRHAEQKAAAKHETAIHSADKMADKTPSVRPPRPGSASGEAGIVLNDQDDRAVTAKMVSAPDPGLTEDTAQGSMPRIGVDGRQPWEVYARPFNTSDPRPRVAIVVADLGLARVASDAAIARLPANVTLSFDAQSPVVGAWFTRARQDGHETLLQVPMESFDYPRSDAGSGALLTTLPNSDNIARLMEHLREGSGYVGVTTMTGSRFTATPEKMRPVLELLKERGLMVFDARVAPHSVVYDMAHDMHMPAAAETESIDDDLSPEGIDKALDQLEKDTLLNGRAIGVVAPVPVLIDKLQAWLKELPDHGIALAPVSAMVQ